MSRLIKVVVIDDHVFNLGYKNLLTMMGFAVEVAVNGHQGIQCVKEFEPDVVLLDSQMPGMDGFEVAKRLRTDPQTASLPIIMISASDDPTHRKQAKQNGINDYLTKPIADYDHLTQTIHHALSRAQHDDTQSIRAVTEPALGELNKKSPQELMPNLGSV